MNFERWLSLKQAWGQLSRREQRLLLSLAGLVLVLTGYLSIWQPTRQRLETAGRQYRQQVELSARIQRAEPASAVAQPLSVRVNESATQAGLDIAEMDIDGDSLRLVVRGDARQLLDWLDQREQEGTALQSLTLQARDSVLEARGQFVSPR